MGKSNKDLIEGLDIKVVVDELNKAYADEWLAFFAYMSLAQTATGKSSFRFAEAVKEIAMEELEHAEELAERILQLGGELVTDFMKLNSLANCKYPTSLPKPKDLEGMAKFIYDAEQCAIGVYDKVLKLTKDKDILTYQLVLHIIEEEADHEIKMEQFLGL
ncbi:MAG: ferritin-like domain-containing protein [Candidatus Heimdallarchaeota archaeon]|nr:ferritin-like domain-containing protein [Candidatus Heimdallarchaeota archaeon]